MKKIAQITPGHFMGIKNSSLQLLLDHLPESIFITNENLEIIFYNSSFLTLFGYQSYDIMSLKDIFPHEKQFEKFQMLLNHGEVKSEKFLFKKKDDSIFWGNITCNIDDSNEKCFQFIITDLNEEIFTRIRYNHILEHALSAIILFNEEGIVNYFNKSAEDLFGLNRENIIGFSIKSFLPESCIERFENLKTCTKPYEAERYKSFVDLKFTKTNGKEFWGTVVINTVELGQDTQYSIFIINCTERMKFQSLLQEKNDELSKINLQLDAFLYSAFHDLRSPLTTLLGLVEVMKIEMVESIYPDMIKKTVKKLDKVLQDMMSFSKNNKQYVRGKQIHLEQFLTSIILEVKNELGCNDFIINVNYDIKTLFYSDEERLKPAFSNIIRNSIQFRDSTKTNNFLIINVKSQNGLFIEFIDNGIGIAKDHQPKIFEMFYRATEKSTGSGLGLYLVKETVEKLKGEVIVISELKVGTTISLSIPNHSKGNLIIQKQNLIA
jgi:PAS domain S-box-containing protein